MENCKNITMALESGASMLDAHGHAINTCKQSIQQCVDSIMKSSKEDKPICIVDYGTADGSAIMSTLNEIIAMIRSYLGNKKEIVVVHEDQECNNFNILMKNIHGIGSIEDLHIDENVYSLVSGRRMHEQCLPNGSVDLVLSSIALMHLTRRPYTISNGIGEENLDPDSKGYAMFAEQARLDWRNFLLSRGKELRLGGYMIILTLAKDKHGNRSQGVCNDILGSHPLSEIYRGMLQDGLITQNEMESTQYDKYGRTEEEHKEPFESDFDVKNIGLSLKESRVYRYFVNPEKYNDTTTGDVFARQIISGFYPWTYYVIFNGLSNERGKQEKEKICDAFYERLGEYAKQQPDFRPSVLLNELVIEKH